MDDLMMAEAMAEDTETEETGTETPETGEPGGDSEEDGPGTEEPETEEPETEEPGITLDEVVRRFGTLLALTDDEAERERDLCAAALLRVEEERNRLPGGEGPLMDYAAALAGHRFVLRCLARGITVAIGDPRSGPAGARCAAKELEEDYRTAASRWLRPRGFCFRRTAGTGKGGCGWTR